MFRIAHIENSQIINVSLRASADNLPPGQMLEADALAAGYVHASPAPVARTIWPNGEAFLRSLELSEIAAISLSTDPTIAALRLLLVARTTEVWSDDPELLLGMSRAVALGIFTEDRKTQLLTP